MDGIILVNKPKDMTSRDVVNIVCKTLNTRSVGHTGTLDPIATGLLAIAINKGVKIVDFLVNDTKEYIATVQFGILTDTLDVTGKVLDEVKDYVIDEEKLKQVLDSFVGKMIQEVPKYSAVKVAGKRLYEYARKGEEVEIPKREIEIFNIELLTFDNEEFSFKVTVSKGTYIRSLIRDIGIKLGIPCSMKELIRTKQGNFKIEDSYTIDEIKDNNYKVIPIKDCLSNYTTIEVDDFIANKVLNGRILENRYKDDIIVFTNKDEVLAIYKVYDKDTTKVKPIKVLR